MKGQIKAKNTYMYFHPPFDDTLGRQGAVFCIEYSLAQTTRAYDSRHLVAVVGVEVFTNTGRDVEARFGLVLVVPRVKINLYKKKMEFTTEKCLVKLRDLKLTTGVWIESNNHIRMQPGHERVKRDHTNAFSSWLCKQIKRIKIFFLKSLV